MSNTTINIATLNLSLAAGATSSNLLEQLLASAAVVTCEELSTGCADAAPAATPVYGVDVMVVNQTLNSSTGFELSEATRVNNGQVDLATVAPETLIAVPADSRFGQSLKNRGLVRTNGFVNFYNRSGNFGKTIHVTVGKANHYGDGDFTVIEVFLADAADAAAAVRAV